MGNQDEIRYWDPLTGEGGQGLTLLALRGDCRQQQSLRSSHVDDPRCHTSAAIRADVTSIEHVVSIREGDRFPLLKIRSAAEKRTELTRTRSPSIDWLAQAAVGKKLREVPPHAVRVVPEFTESVIVERTPGRREGEQQIRGRLVEAYEIGENATGCGTQDTPLTSL
jgi:hypothetical protein